MGLTVALNENTKAPYRATKRLKAAERRGLILEAAATILLEKGFSALTVRNTSEVAGIRMATLQYSFQAANTFLKQPLQTLSTKHGLK